MRTEMDQRTERDSRERSVSRLPSVKSNTSVQWCCSGGDFQNKSEQDWKNFHLPLSTRSYYQVGLSLAFSTTLILHRFKKVLKTFIRLGLD